MKIRVRSLRIIFDVTALLPAAALLLNMLVVSAASAKDLYENRMTVDGIGTVARGTNDLREIDKLFRSVEIEEIFPSYTGVESVRLE